MDQYQHRDISVWSRTIQLIPVKEKNKITYKKFNDLLALIRGRRFSRTYHSLHFLLNLALLTSLVFSLEPIFAKISASLSFIFSFLVLCLKTRITPTTKIICTWFFTTKFQLNYSHTSTPIKRSGTEPVDLRGVDPPLPFMSFPRRLPVFRIFFRYATTSLLSGSSINPRDSKT